MNYESMDRDNDGVIEGRNAVIEAFRAGIRIDKVFIAKGETDSTLRHIAGTARDSGATVVEADRRKLDSLSITNSHQGVIAMASYAEYVEISDILELAKKRNEQPLVIICDELSDPHNLGAIIRTCEATGAHGVIIPKRRSVGVNATVAKASSGAVYHTAIARVTNLTAAIKELKDAGVWVYGAFAGDDESTDDVSTDDVSDDVKAQSNSQGNASKNIAERKKLHKTSPQKVSSLWELDFTSATALVIGSEGKGINRLVGENCDFKVSIPMSGKLSSLNASVSAAVLLYEVVRQRYCKGVG